MTMEQQRVPLAQQLLAAALVTEVQLELAEREQERHGGQLAQILVQLGFVDPNQLAEFLGRQAGTHSVDLNRLSVDQSVLAVVPLEVARRCVAMPLSRENGTLTVALADPFPLPPRAPLHTVTRPP